MAIYELHFFDLSQISTDDPDGFSNNGGYQFDPYANTVTIAPGAVSQAISVDDPTDNFFDDDAGTNQTLNGPATLNGNNYLDGTLIEMEYRTTVEDSVGNSYELLFVSADNDAFNIVGFVIYGAVPPFGEALTITSTADNQTGTYRYAESSPACFGQKTRITTLRGHIHAMDLRVGDHVVLADGTTARVELLLTSPTDPTCEDHVPIRLSKGCLGSGLPKRDLILSPQHRVWMGAAQALVPARALLCLPGVTLARDQAGADLVHVVLKAHDILLAEGLPCESYWPGRVAMAGLGAGCRRQVRAIMGNARPAAPMPDVQRSIHLLKGDAMAPAPQPPYSRAA